jgi:hypothetical protein
MASPHALQLAGRADWALVIALPRYARTTPPL